MPLFALMIATYHIELGTSREGIPLDFRILLHAFVEHAWGSLGGAGGGTNRVVPSMRVVNSRVTNVELTSLGTYGVSLCDSTR
jgi:hypothetical protein